MVSHHVLPRGSLASGRGFRSRSTRFSAARASSTDGYTRCKTSSSATRVSSSAAWPASTASSRTICACASSAAQNAPGIRTMNGPPTTAPSVIETRVSSARRRPAVHRVRRRRHAPAGLLYSRRRPTRKTPDRPQCEMFRRVFGVGIQDAQQRRSVRACLLISCCVLLGQLRHGGTPSSRVADRQASALAFACWNSSSVIAPRSRSSASRAISSAAPLPSDWTALRI